jgi:hypothetical protein
VLDQRPVDGRGPGGSDVRLQIGDAHWNRKQV